MKSKTLVQAGGIRNMGNTCFMGASLQCMLRAGPFQRELKTRSYDHGSQLQAAQQFLFELLTNQEHNRLTVPRMHIAQLSHFPG